MFRINPISYGNNNYHLVRNNKNVKPIDRINAISNDVNNSNSFGFGKNLEEEMQKRKKKGKKNG